MIQPRRLAHFLPLVLTGAALAAILLFVAIKALTHVVPPLAEPPATPIQHVVVIMQENRSFDNLFNGFEPISGQALDSNLVRTVTAAPPRTIRITLTTDF